MRGVSNKDKKKNLPKKLSLFPQQFLFTILTIISKTAEVTK